jgi:hypothetical protein
VASVGTIGGFAGIIGGALAILGWMLPWFGLGAALGSLFGGIRAFSMGAGSGLQLLLASIAAMFSGSGSGFLIGLILAVVLITIPILGLANALTGIKAVERRSSAIETDVSNIGRWTNQLRNRSAAGCIIMVLIYALISIIPFLTALLGSGFYLAAGAFVITFLGALYAKSQIRP